jgi:adenine-specific DNA-methyltransferase
MNRRHLAEAPKVSGQLPLWAEGPAAEHPDYLTKQLITYLGNKRALLKHIEAAVEKIKQRLNKARISFFDVFSGSGVVSRLLKAHSSHIISNDLEDYATVTSRCFLANRRDVDLALLEEIITDINSRVEQSNAPRGFIEDMYAPKDEANITASDRVFYTRSNARRLDIYRQLIHTAPENMRDFLLAPLISAASIHANTAGVFKGFYKNKATKVGQFGGSGSDALLRIRGDIRLEVPVLSNFECSFEIFQDDAHAAALRAQPVDLAYLDPPYNQHPYGSNYFMLNLLVRYKRPERVSRVSGIPEDWNRSGYNVKAESLPLLHKLATAINARFLLVSFNNEGYISPADMRQMLDSIGKVEVVEMPYNAFRASRSFKNRSLHVTEHLFLVEKN